MKRRSQLLGKFFHTFDEGKLCRQGEVLNEEGDGLFLVRHFEWIMGGESTQQLVAIQDMKDWIFYTDAETMRYYGDARLRQERSQEHER